MVKDAFYFNIKSFKQLGKECNKYLFFIDNAICKRFQNTRHTILFDYEWVEERLR